MNNELLQQELAQDDLAINPDELRNRIGHVTRALHDSLSGLGLDSIMEHIVEDMPDARDRLNYVAKMTEQAAEKVLNATDIAIPLQSDMATSAETIGKRWRDTLANPSLKSEYDKVAEETLTFLSLTEKNTTETKALLMDIMMAQDFQDLTGQVIKKITALAQDMERQLVQVLIDFSPGLVKPVAPKPSVAKEEPVGNEALMHGPQIDPTAVDVMADQEQVDDLLASLGF